MIDKKILAVIIAAIVVLLGAFFALQGFQFAPILPQAGEQPQAGAQPTKKTFDMTIFHTGYSPSTIRVKAGDTVEIRAVTAPGTNNHNHGITIDEYGINQAVTTEDRSNPEVITFLADKKGTFSIYCGPCREGIFGLNHPDIRATLIVE
jgi:plastocyanin